MRVIVLLAWLTAVVSAAENYRVWVSPQYDPKKPAAVVVFTDNIDEATARRALEGLPVSLGVFVERGASPSDALGEVAQRYAVSPDPNDHAIVGGAEALREAWMRPDVFRRVAGGGDAMAPLVRKSGMKPLRVYFRGGGDEAFSALQAAGYACTRGDAPVADVLRWLWQGAPAKMVQDWTGWELLGGGYQLTADSTVDRDGNVYFTDARHNRIYKIDLDGRIRLWKEGSGGAHGIAYGPDGRLYVGQHDKKRIAAFTADGKESVVAEGVQTHHLIVTSRGTVYACEAPAHRVWMVNARGEKRVAHEGLKWPRGQAATADGSRLVVADAHTRWVWRFDVAADGSLLNGKEFCPLETGGDTDADPDGMTFDGDGFLYVAGKFGVQICDPEGRVTSILNGPGGAGVNGAMFAGPGLAWLYVTDGERAYRRMMKPR